MSNTTSNTTPEPAPALGAAPTRGPRPATRVPAVVRGDAGMATAEYAIATLAACGFAALLVTILASDAVRGLLLGIVQRALSMV